MRALCSAVLLSLLAASGLAQAPYLVTDLRLNPEHGVSSDPSFFGLSLGSAVFFRAPNGNDTDAVWRTDGTAAGTLPVIPLRNGNSSLSSIVLAGNVAYFSVIEPGGARIWKSDGTVAGTVPVTPLGSTAGYLLVSVIGERYFLMTESRRELWVLDGAAPRRLAEIRPGQPRTTSFRPAGNTLYAGTEAGLWKTDGTAAGTVQLTSVGASRLTLFKNRIYFAGIDAAGSELWTTDGTVAGTHTVADLNPGSASTFGTFSSIVALDDRLVFMGVNGELGSSDGTAGGTRILRTGSEPVDFTSLTVLNGTAYFAFNGDGEADGLDLWRSDGTDAGTRKIRDFAPDGVLRFSIVAGATRVYFVAREEATALFQSDGTTEGTRPVIDLSFSGGTVLSTVGDRVFFTYDDGLHGREPWTSDGTAAGTHMIANLAAEAAGSSYPRELVAGDGRLFFVAQSDERDFSIWSTDGSAQETKLAMERDSETGELTPLAALGDTLYVKLRGSELWKIAGEPGTEVLVKDFKPGNIFAQIRSATVIDGRLFLHVEDGSGTEVWTTDGTTQGTVKLTDIPSSAPTGLTALAGEIYTISGNGVLYGLGSTPAETRRIARTEETTSVWAPVIPFQGALYLFAEAQRTSESILWRFSGSPADATVVKRFDTNVIVRPWAATAGERLLFTWQESSSHTNQLWSTDGTPEGTAMLREFFAGPAFTSFTRPVSLGDRVVFGVDDGIHGIEPWVSDGTPEGTLLLRDIHPSDSSQPSEFIVADDVAYFSATDDQLGHELWRTDGTPGGTQLVADLAPGSDSSLPAGMTRVGDVLYFSATTNETGRELWAYPLPPTATVAIDDVRAHDSHVQAAIPVRLTRPSSARVTVRYATADGTAAAGRDYTAVSGTVTFEPGETLKSIAVPLLNDPAPRTIRALTVRLESDDAPVTRPVGAIVIEDADPAADVALSLKASTSYPMLNVTNNGTSGASNVRLCVALIPENVTQYCGEPFELGIGETVSRTVFGSGTAIVAHVTQWERDPDPSNNRLTSLSSGTGSSSLYVMPMTPRAGESGILSVAESFVSGSSTVELTSSDPTVLSVPPSVVIPVSEASASTTFNALKAGTVTITAKMRFGTQSVVVRVAGADETGRNSAVTHLEAFTAWRFGDANTLTAYVNGLSEDGARPTGHVTFFEDDREIGQVPLIEGIAKLILYDPTPGPARRYAAVYSGDANFFDASITLRHTIFIHKDTTFIRAVKVPGTSDVVITLRGIPGYAPTGTVTVTGDGVERPLVPLDDASSSATISGIPDTTRNVAIAYSGDAHYDAATITIPIDIARRRSAGH
ncbi:MAG TPA: ELWxxDGT repeat protein [Thermoanaerobaculia bacterium]|nr:ELWxxDGT repeat protein [Thermoanaerobaculia bacterium]